MMESLSVKVDRAFQVLVQVLCYVVQVLCYEVQVGRYCTRRSVARNQVPRTNRIVSLRGFKLSIAFPKTDLKPLNNNLQHIKLQFRIQRHSDQRFKNIFSWKSMGEVIHKGATRILVRANIITIRKIFDEERRELTLVS